MGDHSPYQSHPGKLLREHLQEVAEAARRHLDHPALRYRELLREAAYLVGLAHDVGKYTSYFQKHLQNGTRFEGGLERHGFLSATLTAWILWQRRQTMPDAPGKQFLPLLGYLVVHRHHGHLLAPEVILPPLGDLRRASGELRRALRAWDKQLSDLRQNRIHWLSEWKALDLWEALDFVDNQGSNGLSALFSELGREVYALEKLKEEDGVRLGLWGQLLFSALIDADKFSAANLSQTPRHTLPADLVEQYLRLRFPTPRYELDRLRLEFHQTVRAQVERLNPKQLPGQILALTAPTGMGKTLAALDTALRLRAKLQTLWGHDHPPRIIYTLPFINIVEQNYKQFYSVLRLLGQPSEALLLRHHHLAEIAYRTDSTELPLEQALLMVEAWESEIIVTTFVQLFQTILGYQNHFLKKLHNLVGAIVILDEVQALPIEYWPLAAKIFETLGRELGLIVLQMTATRPLIFPALKVQELHPNPSLLFRRQRRTCLYIEQKELLLDEWVARIAELFEKHGSLLVIVNTVQASLKIYKQLRELLGDSVTPYRLQRPDEAKPWLVYLSTNIVPWQRRTRLQALKQHLSRGRRALVISTQVVEAGVDIDFPAVMRELGPIDAVIQAAGRCNREGVRPLGCVYILPLQGGGLSRVYGAIHAHIAKRLLLEGPQVLDELTYPDLVEHYFCEIQARLSQDRSRQLWQAYTRLAYDRLDDPTLSEFHLIESPEQVPIFVALTSKRENWLLGTFRKEVLEERDLKRRREAYLRCRRLLHDLTVRPLLRRAMQNLPPSLSSLDPGTLHWVPAGQLETFYNLETGFIWMPEYLDHAWIG